MTTRYRLEIEEDIGRLVNDKYSSVNHYKPLLELYSTLNYHFTAKLELVTRLVNLRSCQGRTIQGIRNDDVSSGSIWVTNIKIKLEMVDKVDDLCLWTQESFAIFLVAS